MENEFNGVTWPQRIVALAVFAGLMWIIKIVVTDVVEATDIRIIDAMWVALPFLIAAGLRYEGKLQNGYWSWPNFPPMREVWRAFLASLAVCEDSGSYKITPPAPSYR